MQIFVDSSDHNLWAKYRRAGWAFGATTNPLILQREGKTCTPETYRDMVRAAKDAGLYELQIQATGDLVETGEIIAGLWENIVVKIPLTADGLAAAAHLKKQGARVTMTAAYATHPMIAASALGADYIAPYYGRLLEAGHDGDAIVDAMLRIGAPKVLLASLRNIGQMEALAARGHDTFTISPALCAELGQTAMSDTAAADFEIAALGGRDA